MKEIPLTKGQVAIVDDDDFELLSQWKWQAWWSDTTRSFYAVRRTLKGSRPTMRMHREVLGLADADPLQCDHINHDTLDNRRVNLRAVTCRQNNMNRRIRSDNTSGVKGVYWRKDTRKFRAQVQVNGRKIMLGQYSTLEQAAQVARNAMLDHHGEFARTE